MTVTVTKWLTVALAAVTETEYDPAATTVEFVIFKTVVPGTSWLIVTLVLLKVTFSPVAEVLLVKLRVPLKPWRLLTVIVDVARDDDLPMVTVLGLAESAKSEPGIEHIVKGGSIAGVTIEAATIGLEYAG